MAAVIKNFNYVFGELYDDRTKDMWPSIGTVFTIVVSYVYFCKKAGPAYMKNRKPYKLTNTIFYYNIFQIIVCFYTFFKGTLWIKKNFNWTCQPDIQGDTPVTREIINLVWLYAFVKYVDLLDTVFFVLRKKSRQISGLHVYHHILMVIAAFLGIKYFPTGHSVFIGVINSFVHSIMYTYYLISGLGPQYQKYLWWKKYITVMQMVQFTLVFIHNLIPLLNGCDYPKWINWFMCLNSVIFVYMFGSFYYEKYVKPQKIQRVPIKSE